MFEIHPEAEEDWMRIVVALGFTLVSLAVMAAGVTLWQEGEADIVGRAGDLIIVPLKKVHGDDRGRTHHARRLPGS